MSSPRRRLGQKGLKIKIFFLKKFAKLSQKNIGFQIKPYNEVNEKLPFEINLGISQKLENAPIPLISLSVGQFSSFP